MTWWVEQTIPLYQTLQWDEVEQEHSERKA